MELQNCLNKALHILKAQLWGGEGGVFSSTLIILICASQVFLEPIHRGRRSRTVPGDRLGQRKAATVGYGRPFRQRLRDAGA